MHVLALTAIGIVLVIGFMVLKTPALRSSPLAALLSIMFVIGAIIILATLIWQ